MSTDALVLDRPGPVSITTVDQELHRLFLPPGRSYVVLAKGQLFARQAPSVSLRLEGFGVTDEARFSHLAPGEEFSDEIGEADPLVRSGQASFSLAIVAALPDDPDLFVVARIFGSASGGRADLRNVKIIALAVDSITMSTD